MNHVDVFTGIAGFALAAREVWGNDYKNICFCDNNKFCQEVIKKNFGKGSLIYGDIKEVTRERIITDTERMRKLQPEGRKQNQRGWTCDILTGGFPCQPFSQAGERRGTEDDRFLWPEMLRVIKDTSPRWIIAENVRGIINIEDGVVFEQGCLDLEIIGYEAQPLIIPACAVDAPHRRDRVWIVANYTTSIRRREKNKIQTGRRGTELSNSNAPDTNQKRSQRREREMSERKKKNDGTVIVGKNGITWDENWLEVASEFCRVDDGLPAELDEFKLTKAGHRVERLKALGNAIVPQVAMEIMKAIKKTDAEANK